MRFDRWSLAVLLMAGIMGASLASAQENSGEMAAPSAPAAEMSVESGSTRDMPQPVAPTAEEAQPAEGSAEAETPATPAPPMDREMEWIWGEVVGVDGATKEVTIKHLDYDTYEEAKTILSLDEKTAYENVEGLAQIKAGDHVTADYYKLGSRNVVELLVLEKDELLTEPAPAAEAPAAAPAADVPAPAEVPAAMEPAPTESPSVAAPADVAGVENPPITLPSDPAPVVPSVAEEAQVPTEASSTVPPSSEAPTAQ
jgi:Cu/Ag efflux protein CusF